MILCVEKGTLPLSSPWQPVAQPNHEENIRQILRGTFYRLHDGHHSKLLRSAKTRPVREAVTAKRCSRRHDDGGTLEQEKGIRKKNRINLHKLQTFVNSDVSIQVL